MKLSEFIAEIHTDLFSFSDNNDIDDISIKLNVIRALRELGLAVCTTQEKVLHIENSRAELPEDFKSLKLALLLDPLACNEHARNLQTDNYVVRQWIENPAFYDDTKGEYITNCKSKIITETVTINDKPAEFYYNYKYLSVIKGAVTTDIANDCLNINPSIRGKYPDKISITNNMLNTNFSKGSVYIQYYALPTEDGELVIPQYTVGSIYTYIKQFVKTHIAETLIANNANAQGLRELYPTWIAMLPSQKAAAIREAKMYSLPKDWTKKYRAKNEAYTRKFNLPKLR